MSPKGDTEPGSNHIVCISISALANDNLLALKSFVNSLRLALFSAGRITRNFLQVFLSTRNRFFTAIPGIR
jgi:hypothetical protein